jgi:hypothetical protein
MGGWFQDRVLQKLNTIIENGGGVPVSDKYCFEHESARDTYFLNNPDELIAGMRCIAGGNLQEYDGTSWKNVIGGP